MKIYLVGGAVRDKLLGIIPKEKDWVVVNSNPNELLSLGYKQVGKNFQYFLHPETSEEYALARIEIKTKDTKGFNLNTNENVTLEQDLLRRDLTINAIAEDDNGNLIDPYNGIKDLEDRVIRHVSEAFFRRST
jgi:tRNA nucleotidyltransferase (CCA-adding enzyme)